MELLRREKNAGIIPDQDIDIFIKVWRLRKVCFLGYMCRETTSSISC